VALVGCVQPPAEEESGEAAQATVGEDLLLASTKITLPPPGIGPADLPDPESDGAQYLRQYCTSCHALPGPGSFSATGWPVYLRRMWRRMDALDAKYNVAVPTSAERVVLTRYLIDNALEVTRADLPPGQGRDLYRRECSRCHELPNPAQHSAADWPSVVIRMREHSAQMLRRSPTQFEVQEIILYLEVHRAKRGATLGRASRVFGIAGELPVGGHALRLS
jgi:cytochrome c5